VQCLADAIDHVIQVLGPGNNVERIGLNGQQAPLPLGVGKESLVSAVELINISPVHIPLVGAVAVGNTLHERIRASAQVDHQVRLGDFLCQGCMHAVIYSQLIAFQVDAGKQRIFIKGVIGDNHMSGSQSFGDDLMLLLVAAEQEEDLRLEGIAAAVAIKVGEEGIFLENFEQKVGRKSGVDKARQGGLADSDNAFDGYIHKVKLPGAIV